MEGEGGPELTGAAGDGIDQADAVDEELALAGDHEAGVAEHVATEHDGTARLVAGGAAAGGVEQVVAVPSASSWAATATLTTKSPRPPAGAVRTGAGATPGRRAAARVPGAARAGGTAAGSLSASPGRAPLSCLLAGLAGRCLVVDPACRSRTFWVTPRMFP
jgi:hypothetical protein